MIIGMEHGWQDIRRIEQTLERFGERFKNRVHPDRDCSGRAPQAFCCDLCQTLCARKPAPRRWEPVAPSRRPLEAYGRRQSANWKADARTDGGAAKRLAELTPKGWTSHVHLSITDDMPYALAMVIIEAFPPWYRVKPTRQNEQDNARASNRCRACHVCRPHRKTVWKKPMAMPSRTATCSTVR